MRLDTADLKQGALAARLTAPSTIEVQGQDIAIDNLLLDVGGGRIGVRGTVAETLSLAVSIDRLPLAIANAIRPDLALGGTIDGSAAVTGTRSAPDIAFDLKGLGDCCRGPSPGRPQDGRRLGEGNLERAKAYRQCHRSKPRRVAGNGRRHGSARRRRAGSRRQPEIVSARRAECRSAWPGAWRHDLRIRQNRRLSGAAERRTSTSAATASARPLLDDLGLSPLKAAAAGSFSDQVVTLSSANASAAGRVDAGGEWARRPRWCGYQHHDQRSRAACARQPLSRRPRHAILRHGGDHRFDLRKPGEADGEGHGFDVRCTGGRPRGQFAAGQRRARRRYRWQHRDDTPRLRSDRQGVARSARQERFPWLATCLPTFAFRSTMPAMPTAILSLRP